MRTALFTALALVSIASAHAEDLHCNAEIDRLDAEKIFIPEKAPRLQLKLEEGSSPLRHATGKFKFKDGYEISLGVAVHSTDSTWKDVGGGSMVSEATFQRVINGRAQVIASGKNGSDDVFSDQVLKELKSSKDRYNFISMDSVVVQTAVLSAPGKSPYQLVKSGALPNGTPDSATVSCFYKP